MIFSLLQTTFTFDDHYCMVFELLNPRQLNKYFEDLPPGDAVSTPWVLAFIFPSAFQLLYNYALLLCLQRLPFVRQVALHLLQSLGFLQQQNVIHADLKPENILLKDGTSHLRLPLLWVPPRGSLICISFQMRDSKR